MRNILAIAIVSLFVSTANAQEIVPKYTFNVDIGLPVALRSEPFKDYMQGLVCANIYGQYSFPFHLNIGLGGRYSLFTINEFSVPDQVNGSVQAAGGFIKIGYDKFHYERFATDFSVKIGYTENFATSNLNKEQGFNPRQIGSGFIEPSIGLILSADEQNSYRLNITYCIQGYQFSPQTIGINSNGGYDPNVFKSPTQFLVFGFGYTYYFKSKNP